MWIARRHSILVYQLIEEIAQQSNWYDIIAGFGVMEKKKMEIYLSWNQNYELINQVQDNSWFIHFFFQTLIWKFSLTCYAVRSKWSCKNGLMLPSTVPHILWDGKQFKGGPPNPSPSLKVEGAIMLHLDTPRLVQLFITSCPGIQVVLIFLVYFNKCLMPTSHRICGIIDNKLRIKGALFMHIRINTRETTDGTCVSNNMSDFYLSGSALKNLLM